MAHGYLEDGNFVNTEEKTKAVRCDVCGNVREQEEMMSHNDYELIDPQALGLEGYRGHANVCGECLVNGIGEEGREKLRNEVFEEKEEESVEL